MNTHGDIPMLLERSTDDLLADLGKDLAVAAGYFAPMHPRRYIESAREWLLDRRSDLRAAICPSEVVRQWLQNPRGYAKAQLAAAVADLLVGYCGGVSPATVAVLLVKEGIDNLCAGG